MMAPSKLGISLSWASLPFPCNEVFSLKHFYFVSIYPQTLVLCPSFCVSAWLYNKYVWCVVAPRIWNITRLQKQRPVKVLRHWGSFTKLLTIYCLKDLAKSAYLRRKAAEVGSPGLWGSSVYVASSSQTPFEIRRNSADWRTQCDSRSDVCVTGTLLLTGPPPHVWGQSQATVLPRLTRDWWNPFFSKQNGKSGVHVQASNLWAFQSQIIKNNQTLSTYWCD